MTGPSLAMCWSQWCPGTIAAGVSSTLGCLFNSFLCASSVWTHPLQTQESTPCLIIGFWKIIIKFTLYRASTMCITACYAMASIKKWMLLIWKESALWYQRASRSGPHLLLIGCISSICHYVHWLTPQLTQSRCLLCVN